MKKAKVIRAFVLKHALRVRRGGIFEVEGSVLPNQHLRVDRFHVIDGIPIRVGSDYYKQFDWAPSLAAARRLVALERLKRAQALRAQIARLQARKVPVVRL